MRHLTAEIDGGGHFVPGHHHVEHFEIERQQLHFGNRPAAYRRRRLVADRPVCRIATADQHLPGTVRQHDAQFAVEQIEE
ncbi:MAG: hypothetical protein LWW83_05050 [Azonexaceae bacterium]|nr:hypothetical protein [Azonexaceae bacterium]